MQMMSEPPYKNSCAGINRIATMDDRGFANREMFDILPLIAA